MLKSDKPKKVEELKNLLETYNVVGILNMQSLPAKQLQQIRNNLKGIAVIKMSRKSLMKKALEGSTKKDIRLLEARMINSPSIIFSNENPFRLFSIIKSNRSAAPAKAGTIAANDIVIQKGKTGIPPGPAISTLQKLNLKTSVQEGKIAIIADKTAVKTGEMITSDMVNAFNLLKMEPVDIGLDVVAVWENGTIYGKDVLDIDVNDYRNRVILAVSSMINLSINSGYLVPMTADLALQKAFMEAKQLAIEANIIDKSIIDELLIKAIKESAEMEKTMPAEAK